MLVSSVLALFLLIVSSAACAGSVDINVSNRAAQFDAGYTSGGNAEMQGGFFYNDQGSVLLDAGLIAKGEGDQESASGMSGGGGVKVISGKILQAGTGYFVTCIAIGGQAIYTFPDAPLLALAGEYFTALKIVSFGDTNRYNQFGLRLEMGPPHAKFFVGYREITFSIIGTGNVSLDKGGYTGVMFSF